MVQGCGLFFLQRAAWSMDLFHTLGPMNPTRTYGKPDPIPTPSRGPSSRGLYPIPPPLSRRILACARRGRPVPGGWPVRLQVRQCRPLWLRHELPSSSTDHLCCFLPTHVRFFFVQYDVLGHAKETMSGNSGSLIRMGCWLYYLSNAWVFSMLYLLSFMVYWVYTT